MQNWAGGLRATRGMLGTLAFVAALAAAGWAGFGNGARADNEGLLKEIVIGAGSHDVGVFGRKKESGSDINVELRFQPLEGEFWSWIYSPTPHIGLHYNTSGNTNQVFVGANWLFDIGSGIFGGGSFGFAAHDGETDSGTLGRKDLGLPVLFRESLEIGFKAGNEHSISLMLDHVSNADIHSENEGLDTVSLRYSVGL